MTDSLSRRRIIQIAPLAGIALLAACSPKAEAPATPTPPAVQPAPAPAPEPAAATTTPAPTTAAAPLPALDEKDPQAVALGYVEDASRADTTKFKNHIAGTECAGCALYQGQPGDAAGPCGIFAGKQVSAKGWCSSWVKKA